ncbi:MAG: hypothetical protein KC546_14205 [Anaerolineae bacterium]|nr:hypothetical protein [Anaerolineae bacterium]MCB9459794.1 hypothetical protein [Anaerolineaceae bacterium]
MQVPRHWRMKHQLYRLHGVRHSNGSLGMLNRPEQELNANEAEIEAVQTDKKPVAVRVA